MTDRIFVDSNIWVYLFFNDNHRKHGKAEQYITQSGSKHVLVVSPQVINEVSGVLYKRHVDELQIRKVINRLSKTCLVQDYSLEIALRASDLRLKHSISFWDSLIVASAIAAQCKQLVSEDMQDGFKTDDMVIKNIFAC